MAEWVDDNDDVIISKTSTSSSELSKESNILRNDDLFTDFTLKSGSRVLKCHRAIIAAASPVLKAMLQSKMKEATEMQMTLDIISPQTLKSKIFDEIKATYEQY